MESVAGLANYMHENCADLVGDESMLGSLLNDCPDLGIDDAEILL